MLSITPNLYDTENFPLTIFFGKCDQCGCGFGHIYWKNH